MYVTDTFYRTLCAVFGQHNDTNSTPILRRWQTFEGGNAEWNPFNSEWNWPNATNYNSAGVKNYRTEEDGVNATAHNLQNGLYPNICEALRIDAPLEFWTTPAVIRQVRKWGTTGFANWLASQPKTPIPIPTPFFDKEDDEMLISAPNGVYLLANGAMISVVNKTNEDAFAARLGPPIPVDAAMYALLIAKFQTVSTAAVAPPAVAPPTVV